MPAGRPLKRIKRQAKFLLGRLPVAGARLRLPTAHYGSEYGGWEVLPGLLGSHSEVWSYGIGHDPSFDLEVIRHHGCRVRAFDPTPGLGDWITAQGFDARFEFEPIGLAAFDGEVEMRPQSVDGDSSSTILSQSEIPVDTHGVPVRVERLATTAARLGVTRIDLLKMDIEGAEFEAIPDLLASGVEIGQLLVEFHPYVSNGYPRQREAYRQIVAAGFVLFDLSLRDMEFGFVHRSQIPGE